MECPHCGTKLYLSLVKFQSETESIERRQEWLDAKAQLARKCRMSERTIQRALAEIEELGEIARTFRDGHSTLYQVVLPGCGKPLMGGVSLSPLGETNRAKGETNTTKRGDTAVSQNRQEPSIEPRSAEITPVDELPARVAEIRKSLKNHPAGNGDA